MSKEIAPMAGLVTCLIKQVPAVVELISRFSVERFN